MAGVNLPGPPSVVHGLTPKALGGKQMSSTSSPYNLELGQQTSPFSPGMG